MYTYRSRFLILTLKLAMQRRMVSNIIVRMHGGWQTIGLRVHNTTVSERNIMNVAEAIKLQKLTVTAR